MIRGEPLRRIAFRGALAAGALAAAGWLLFLLLDALFPFPNERLTRPPATVVTARDGEPLRLFLPPDEIWRLPVGIEDVAPEMIRALVASEDRWFWVHPGVNPLSIARAALTNLRAGRIVSGASTIPMQLARLAEPRPRTLWAKGVEAFRALQLVHHGSRKEILARYLELAPFGGNLEGIGAAALFHFGKRPDELSIGEAALLTALPRAPSAYDPARNPGAARAARNRVLDRLVLRGVISAGAAERARRQPLPRARHPVPFASPHFARWAIENAPGRARIATTLDRGLQLVAEDVVRARIGELRGRGVDNAAAVVIENDAGALRALVGSADFFEPGYQGQVNAAVARRSPGSALKPFLYALAFDDGQLIPDAYLLDVPTDFAGYVAENYDGLYHGRVTTRGALIRSLNAPAVALAARVGLRRFLDLLRRGGLTTLDRPASSYGLPLVLGAGEVTLLDLTNLYASLARGGIHRPLRWTAGASRSPERLLSREAAHMTLSVLSQLERPDLPHAWTLTRDVPAVAWKTGTSYGHRDAWAIGVSERYAIGVWTGNPDGHGQPGLSGSRDAAPLLFDLFRAIEPSGSRLPRDPGPRAREASVCALSHERPGPFCGDTVHVPVIDGISRLPTCTHHRRVFVDDETGDRLAGACLGRRPHHATILEVFPPELTAWWQARGRTQRPTPRLHPSCREVPGGEEPRIVSPSAETPYRLRSEAPRAYQRVQLLARAASGTARLFWYHDGRMLGSTRPEVPLFAKLERGSHRVVVVDDAGRSWATSYTVE